MILPTLRIGFLLCCVAWSSNLPAATLLVDRTGQLDADYRSVQEAMAVAQDGDTVYIAPANVSYGNVELKASIRLIGAGIPSGELLTWRAGQHSRIEQLTFFPGADGALVMGCDIRRLNYQNPEVDEREHPHGVTFFRNHIESVSVGLPTSTPRPMNNLRFINNMIGSIGIGDQNRAQDFNNVQVLNNIIGGGIGFLSRVTGMTGICRNNFFYSNTSYLELNNWSVSFVDNVLLLTAAGQNFRSGLFQNVWPPLTAGNVFIGDAPLKMEDESKNTEIAQADYKSVLPKWDSNLTPRRPSNAAEWARIADDHPAKTAGVDGGEPGIFGGPHPFDLYQMPPLPFISRVEAPAIVGEGEGMQVTVEIKSHR